MAKMGENGNSERLHFFGFTITVDGDCRHEIKTLAPWKKSYEKLDIMLRSRGITLSTKVNIVKVMLFQAVMYGCEYLTTKMADTKELIF